MWQKFFGENVFDDAVMRERCPKGVYKKLKQTIEDGSELDPSIADVVAHAMKDWAVDNGGDPLYPLVPAADRRYGGKTAIPLSPVPTQPEES